MVRFKNLKTMTEVHRVTRDETMKTARKIRDQSNYGAPHWVSDCVKIARTANRSLIVLKRQLRSE